MSLLGGFILYLATGVLLTSLLVMGARYLADSGKVTAKQKYILDEFEKTLEFMPFFVLVVFSVMWLPMLVSSLLSKK